MFKNGGFIPNIHRGKHALFKGFVAFGHFQMHQGCLTCLTVYMGPWAKKTTGPQKGFFVGTSGRDPLEKSLKPHAESAASMDNFIFQIWSLSLAKGEMAKGTQRATNDWVLT